MTEIVAHNIEIERDRGYPHVAELQAGAAVADITPTDSQFLFGYPHVARFSTGVSDPLLSTALCLTDGVTRALFVANDAIFVPRESAGRVRAAIFSATGVPPAHIMLTATHTHSAPKTVEYLSNADDRLVPPVDPVYLQFFEQQMTAAACAAVRAARPAQVGLAVADGTGVGTNRRKVSGPADPQVPVLLVRSADGQEVIACMVVCSMHPTVLRESSTLVSADFPGAARRTLQRTVLPAGCPILYHSGPSGDQSPRHVLRGNSLDEVERLGGLLGDAIGRVIPSIVCRADLSLQVGQHFVALPRRRMPTTAQAEADLIAAAARLSELRRVGASPQEVRRAEVDWFGAEETVTLARAAADGRLEAAYAACMPAEIQTIRVGAWTFVGWPGEIFVEHALTLKALAPDTFVISLANGELQGYIATEEAVAEGGYETSNSLFAPAAGRVLVDTSLALLPDVIGWNRSPGN
jgi:neutral ceramidase